jgi:hypothetical protein
VLTTATRYCDPDCTASVVLKFGDVRNATDCPVESEVLATAEATVNDELVAPVRPAADATSVKPAPGLLTVRVLNVAMPATAATVVVPPRAAPLALVPITIVTAAVAVVTTSPKASCMATATAGVIVPVVGVGWLTKAKRVASPGPTVSVRLTDCGLFVTPVAVDVIGTVALYVPATSAPVAGVSVSVAGAVAPLRLPESHPPIWSGP